LPQPPQRDVRVIMKQSLQVPPRLR
jgi:hypothetical protein